MHRSDWGRIVAGLIRRTGDWTLAEDATQDAFAAAFERWPKDGIPDKPAAWLTTTARHRAIDRLRSAKAERSRLGELSMNAEPSESNDIDDDRLLLIFTCCHPALPLAARVALTLRTVAGLSVAETTAMTRTADHLMTLIWSSALSLFWKALRHYSVGAYPTAELNSGCQISTSSRHLASCPEHREVIGNHGRKTCDVAAWSR